MLQFDGECQTEAFLSIAKQAVSLVESGDGAMGLGIVSILGFEDSYRILEASTRAGHGVGYEAWQSSCS